MLDIRKNSQLQNQQSQISNIRSQISIAPTADEFYKRNTDKEVEDDLLEFLCFVVEGEEYALELSETSEVIKIREITEVPNAPLFISGIISLRGEIIPIISLQKRLGLNAAALKQGQEGSNPEARMVIAFNVDIDPHADGLSVGAEAKIGFVVDRIMGVVRVHRREIESTPSIQKEANVEFIKAVVHKKERLIMQLNLPMLLKV